MPYIQCFCGEYWYQNPDPNDPDTDKGCCNFETEDEEETAEED